MLPVMAKFLVLKTNRANVRDINRKENDFWTFTLIGVAATLLDDIQPYIPFLKEELTESFAIKEAKGILYKPKNFKIE
jgi:hypothetical protein